VTIHQPGPHNSPRTLSAAAPLAGADALPLTPTLGAWRRFAMFNHHHPEPGRHTTNAVDFHSKSDEDWNRELDQIVDEILTLSADVRGYLDAFMVSHYFYTDIY
jgi:hypothetical protein